jgi:hypothetical protein
MNGGFPSLLIVFNSVVSDGMRALPATPMGERRVSAVPPRIIGGDGDNSGEGVRRQASITAGEDIKIVIHDVDSECKSIYYYFFDNFFLIGMRIFHSI